MFAEMAAASKARESRLVAARRVYALNALEEANKLPVNKRTNYLLAEIIAELKIINNKD